MGYISDVKNEIYGALEDYNCEVNYTRKNGDTCAYFTITIDDEWDWDWIEQDIDKMCDEYGLWIDDDSEGSFDLCVSD